MNIEALVSQVDDYFCSNQKIFLRGLYLIGGITGETYINDIDIIAIISDSESKFDFVCQTSHFAVQLSVKFGILVSIFPVFEMDFIGQKNMFLKNVKQNGRKIR